MYHYFAVITNDVLLTLAEVQKSIEEASSDFPVFLQMEYNLFLFGIFFAKYLAVDSKL